MCGDKHVVRFKLSTLQVTLLAPRDSCLKRGKKRSVYSCLLYEFNIRHSNNLSIDRVTSGCLEERPEVSKELSINNSLCVASSLSRWYARRDTAWGSSAHYLHERRHGSCDSLPYVAKLRQSAVKRPKASADTQNLSG